MERSLVCVCVCVCVGDECIYNYDDILVNHPITDQPDMINRLQALI